MCLVWQGMKRMRASGKLAAQVLEYAGSLIKPGVTTDTIDKVRPRGGGMQLLTCVSSRVALLIQTLSVFH